MCKYTVYYSTCITCMCMCMLCLNVCVCVMMCKGVCVCVVEPAPHQQWEAQIWLVSDMKRAATHKRAPVHLGPPQRLNRASRHDVPSWHPIWITLLVTTSTRMVLRPWPYTTSNTFRLITSRQKHQKKNVLRIIENRGRTNCGNESYWNNTWKMNCAVTLHVQSILHKRDSDEAKRLFWLKRTWSSLVWWTEQLLCLFLPLEPPNPARASSSKRACSPEETNYSQTSSTAALQTVAYLGNTLIHFLKG